MGSRSHPRFVLCVCVCVSRCLWVCVIEADSLQLRVITVGYIRSCLPLSDPCSVCRVRVSDFGPFLFLVPRFQSPAAFLVSERRRLICPLLPCATHLCLRRELHRSFTILFISEINLLFSATESSRLHCDRRI